MKEQMDRYMLLYKICPWDRINGCCNGTRDYQCYDCVQLMNKWLDEYDKQIRAKAIDDFANWLVEQGILGNRCISDGEITDYGKVYAKKYKEQLKEEDK